MKLDHDFRLNPGDKIILSKKNGRSIIEFSLHPDPVLDNIVEMWKYDPKKKGKGKSTWLIHKDLSGFVGLYLTSNDFEFELIETKGSGKGKKN